MTKKHQQNSDQNNAIYIKTSNSKQTAGMRAVATMTGRSACLNGGQQLQIYLCTYITKKNLIDKKKLIKTKKLMKSFVIKYQNSLKCLQMFSSNLLYHIVMYTIYIQ